MLINEPLKRGLEILHILCERKDPALIPALRSFLEELESLLPLVAVIETKQFGELLHLPLAAAYDTSVESSLPWLIQRSAALVEKETPTPRASPWRHFLELGDRVSRHFRRLAESPGLASSQMMFYLIQSLQMIASIYLHEIQRARQQDPERAAEIEGQLGWYLSFFWSSAQSATEMSFQWTESATDCLGWIGLRALNEGCVDTTQSALQNIAAVTKAAAAKIPGVASHQLARLLMPMRLMMELAPEVGATHMMDRIQTVEENTLAELTLHLDIKDVLDRYERDCRRERARGGILDPDDPESLLLQILSQRQRGAAGDADAIG
jgi:hypothetical protein